MTDRTGDWPQYLAGRTTHVRRGDLRHRFTYGVDYVLIDPDARRGPLLFSRNRPNLASVSDRWHGGPRGRGRGAAWASEVLARFGAPAGLRLRLLTQPRFLGYVFNPVSFWLAHDGPDLVAVIAEVDNTFGDRHSYFCARPGFAPITAADTLQATKVFHVSPFQDIAGGYAFTFDIRPDRIAIRIAHENGDQGLVAALAGPLRPLTDGAILRAALRRPLGPARTLALIYWNALRLKLKGAAYRPHPIPPQEEITR